MISIIVPIYNGEKYLRACVDSILAQTHTDLELILVDDGSADSSGAICDRYAAGDGRVRVIHQKNSGVASAVTAGIQAAAGEYVGFVDCDDWIDPDYYAQLWHSAQSLHADLCEGQFVCECTVRGAAKTVGALRSRTAEYAGPEDIRRLANQYLLSFVYDGVPDKPDRPLTYGKWDKLYRTQLLRRALPFYDVRLSLGEDVILNAAVLPSCGKVVTVPTGAKYHHRILSDTVSHGADSGQMERILAVHRALARVAAEKDLDAGAARALIGSMIHARIYRQAAAAELSSGERGRRMGVLFRQAPDGTLQAFVRARKSPVLRVFYRLLAMGLTGPCVWLASLHTALTGQKS